MVKIKFLSRYNTCKMNGHAISHKSRFTRSMKPYMCFYAAFCFINEYPDDIYQIRYDLKMYKRYNGKRNNFTCLSKVEMCRLLNSFKAIIPFKYHFIDFPTYYILHMELTGTGLQHKGLLMLCRSLFEYPHNVCGYDTLKLRTMGIVNNIDFTKIPLYNIYLNCIASTWKPGDECFIDRPDIKLISTDELRDKLKAIDGKRISSVVPQKSDKFARGCIGHLKDTKEIYNPISFKNRVNIYIKNYKLNQDE